MPRPYWCRTMTPAQDKDYAQSPPTRNVRRVCAWHIKNFGFEKIISDAEPGSEGSQASHGICPECLEILMQERRRERHES
jgi:hypothetical protein